MMELSECKNVCLIEWTFCVGAWSSITNLYKGVYSINFQNQKGFRAFMAKNHFQLTVHHCILNKLSSQNYDFYLDWKKKTPNHFTFFGNVFRSIFEIKMAWFKTFSIGNQQFINSFVFFHFLRELLFNLRVFARFFSNQKSLSLHSVNMFFLQSFLFL